MVFADADDCDIDEESMTYLLYSSGTLDGARGLINRDAWDLVIYLHAVSDTNQHQGMGTEYSMKTVQHYWVNIVKQQVTGGGCPTLHDTLIQPMEAALNQPTFLTQAQALLGKVISEHTTQRNAKVQSIVNKDRQVV